MEQKEAGDPEITDRAKAYAEIVKAMIAEVQPRADRMLRLPLYVPDEK